MLQPPQWHSLPPSPSARGLASSFVFKQGHLLFLGRNVTFIMHNQPTPPFPPSSGISNCWQWLSLHRSMTVNRGIVGVSVDEGGG